MHGETSAERSTPAAARGGAPRLFYGWWIVGVSVVAQAFAAGLTTYVFGVFQKPVAAEFGASFQTVGIGMTLITVAFAVFSPVVGRALDRHSIRGIITAGGALMALGFCLMSVAPTLWLEGLLIACVIGPGILMLGTTGSPRVVANWFMRRRGRALGISTAGTSVGGLLAPPLAVLAIDAFGWRGALVCFALAMVVIVMPLVWFVIVDRPEDMGLVPDGDAGDGTAEASLAGVAAAPVDWTFGALLRERNFWVIAVSLGMCMAVLASVIINLHPYATDLGIGDRPASLLMSCLSVAGIGGKLLFGALADRPDARPGLWIAIGLLGLYIAVLLSHPGYGVLMVASVSGGLASGGFLPVWGVLVGRCYGRHAFGRVTGLMALVMGPFMWMAFPFTGWVRDVSGSYDGAFWVFLGAIALAAGLLGLLRVPAREPGT